MRSHQELNIDEISIVDLKQMAMMRGAYITDSDRTLDEAPLYALSGEVGLWTFDELRQHFLH